MALNEISLLAISSRFPARDVLNKNLILHGSTGPENAVAPTVFTLSIRFHHRLFRDPQHAAFWIGDKPYFHHFLLRHHSEQLVWRAFPRSSCGLLSWLALDYYSIPPIHAFAVSSARVPEMIVFGATALLISWLNSGPRWVRRSLGQAEESEPALRGIVLKFSLAVLASVAACLGAAVTARFRLGGGLAALWITVSLASCCSALFLIILACDELR